MRKLEYKWVALLVTTIGSMMVAIDSTIVILGLPDMLQDLHSNLVRMTWVLMAYLLVSTVLLLTFGRMADMFGRVKMYNLGFIIFTLGSVACGFSQSDTMLIGSRVVQGLGGAMLSANAMAIITEVFPAKQRGQAMGINAITWGAGSVLGPVLGGIILAIGSWRWIFLVNLPIGIVATLLAYLLLHDIAPNPKGERFDLLGALLFSVGLVALLLAITSGIGSGWFTPPILGLFALAVVSLGLFVVRELRFAFPMLDLSLFENRTYGFSVAAAALQSLAIFAVNFLLIFYLQGVRAFSPLTAALLILPMPLVGSIVGPLSGRWADRIGGTIPRDTGTGGADAGAPGAVHAHAHHAVPHTGAGAHADGRGQRTLLVAQYQHDDGSRATQSPGGRLGHAEHDAQRGHGLQLRPRAGGGRRRHAAEGLERRLPGYGRPSLRHHFSRLHQRHGARLPGLRRDLRAGHRLLLGAPGTPGAAGHSASQRRAESASRARMTGDRCARRRAAVGSHQRGEKAIP